MDTLSLDQQSLKDKKIVFLSSEEGIPVYLFVISVYNSMSNNTLLCDSQYIIIYIALYVINRLCQYGQSGYYGKIIIFSSIEFTHRQYS